MERMKRGSRCTATECGNPVWARQLCKKHYERWRKHGDANFVVREATPAGEVTAFLAAIPLDGDGCLRWPYATNNQGYAQYRLPGPKRGRKLLVSRIQCERRHGPPPSPRHQAAHSCGKGHEGCVAPWHLNWKLPAENQADRDEHGTMLRGEDCSYAKLTEDMVRAIRALKGTASQNKIAYQFGVSQTAISKIFRRKIWAHIE